MRTMYDALNPLNIPDDVEMAASYDDGSNEPPQNWAKRFPATTRIVVIAREPADNRGDVLDAGDNGVTGEELLSWVRLRRANGYAYPTGYCNLSEYEGYRAIFDAAKEPQPLWWVADYSGSPHEIPGAIAVQYIDYVALKTGYDLSLVADYWPGIDPAPIPAMENDQMLIVDVPEQGIWLLSGSLYCHIDTPAVVEALVAAGVKRATIDVAMHETLRAASTTPA